MKLGCLTKTLRIAGVAVALASFTWPLQGQQNAVSHAQYSVTDLGTLKGGSFSQGTTVGNNGVVTGLSDAPDGKLHAVIWRDGKIIDVSKQTPEGANSGAFGVNLWGQILIQSELTTKDPNTENFCAYGTDLACRAFILQNGATIPLPTLGGTNSGPGWINDRGEAVGFAETKVKDPTCPSGISASGTGPQSLDFEAVIWGPRFGEVRALPPLHGDSVGMAFGINDAGQVVGGSGVCSDTVLPGPSLTPHAVLWENGNAISMGSLGGTVNLEAFGVGTIALSINNRGEAVGAAALPGNATSHAFFWSKQLRHMIDLGTVPGDVYSAGLAINDEGDVVGPSIDSDGNLRAYVRKHGPNNTPVDLNELVQADAPLYLLIASAINDRGEIVGFGVDANGDLHGFLAIPCASDRPSPAADLGINESTHETSHEKARPALTERSREILRHRMRVWGFGPSNERSNQ
jgi:probable HAF family extracellular repeat protein